MTARDAFGISSLGIFDAPPTKPFQGFVRVKMLTHLYDIDIQRPLRASGYLREPKMQKHLGVSR